MTKDDTELMLDVGQANELKLAFRKAGWTNADIKKFCERDNNATERALFLVKGEAKLTTRRFLVDCSAKPWAATENADARWWVIKSHRKMGKLMIELREDDLYLGGKKIILKRLQWLPLGGELEKQLAGEEVPNDNVLDFLVKHKGLIPPSWRDTVYFTGTIYEAGSSSGRVNGISRGSRTNGLLGELGMTVAVLEK